MNKQDYDILNAIRLEPFINQRILAKRSGHSLGIVNRSIRKLMEGGYLDDDVQLTTKAIREFQDKSPKNAIILAAGYGMRMVPINIETPKGLLEVHGERLIERIIKQLQEVNIREIYVVVGFMKEHYEYLIDEYGVRLVVSTQYAAKNNLHSLSLVNDKISNTYIIPCDIWCDQNPFHQYELYSWYMVSDLVDNDSSVRVNRKMELVSIPDTAGGNAMIGICYLIGDQAAIVRKRVCELCEDSRYNESFWEEALYRKDRMIVAAKVAPSANVVEINTYEQLRELDSHSNQLQSGAIKVIAEQLDVTADKIIDIRTLKKGMTNRSFLFRCEGEKYIMRIPGEGTNHLINRKHEAAVYHVIRGKGYCDSPLYIDPDTGYKITSYIENARTCNPDDVDDLTRCMEKLRELHKSRLNVEHEFDIFAQIEFYESLWDGAPSAYKDYEATKHNVMSLQKFISENAGKRVLTHIDAVPDNFLLYRDSSGQEQLQLIDWEYAGMQDPHVDIAMFCIYSLYDRQQVDRLIQIYFDGECEKKTRIKIYCYIAACGLLWSNWCEYKRKLGVEFGEYSLRQYRYAKDYYRIATHEMRLTEEKNEL